VPVDHLPFGKLRKLENHTFSMGKSTIIHMWNYQKLGEVSSHLQVTIGCAKYYTLVMFDLDEAWYPHDLGHLQIHHFQWTWYGIIWNFHVYNIISNYFFWGYGSNHFGGCYLSIQNASWGDLWWSFYMGTLKPTRRILFFWDIPKWPPSLMPDHICTLKT
jgi:hypothetical protein